MPSTDLPQPGDPLPPMRRPSARLAVAVVLGLLLVAAGYVGYRVVTTSSVGTACTGAAVIDADPPPSPEAAFEDFRARLRSDLRDGYERHSRTEWRRYEGARSYRRIQLAQRDDGWVVTGGGRCEEVDA